MSLENINALNIGQLSHDALQKMGARCTYKESMPSTQDIAKSNSPSELHFTLCSQQTEGRGRGKNKWEQNKITQGQFFCTVSFPFAGPIEWLSLVTGQLIAESLQQSHLLIHQLGLKAPNDLYLRDKKVGGLLIEAVRNKNQYVYTGIGINVFAHPENVPDAGSLLPTAADFEPLASCWTYFMQDLFKKFNSLSQLAGSPLLVTTEQKILASLNQYTGDQPKFKNLEEVSIYCKQKGY